MFSFITSIAKAATAVVVAPVALVVDVVTLPSTALEGKPAFGRTGSMLDAVGSNIKDAVSGKVDQ